MIIADYTNDLIALFITISMFVGYNIYIRRLGTKVASAVLSQVAIDARSAWVVAMTASPDNGLLAIQTLRNSTMAATFLASTAILLIMGVLTLSGQGPSLKATWHVLNVIGSFNPQIWLFKLLLMLVVLFFVFFQLHQCDKNF